MCKFHLDVARGQRDPTNDGGPSPSRTDLQQSALSTSIVKRHQAISAFVVAEQARTALAKLRNPAAHDASTDPRSVLLDSVHSAWRQRQVWEAMLASVPEEDYAMLGQPPLPGSLASSKGARIETIQRMLSEATKVAARTSKLAIDAGIEERLVRLAEEQAALIADTVRAGLIAGIHQLAKDLGLTPGQQALATETALQTAASQLRQLAAGPGPIVEGVATVMPDGVGGRVAPEFAIPSNKTRNVTPTEPTTVPNPPNPPKATALRPKGATSR